MFCCDLGVRFAAVLRLSADTETETGISRSSAEHCVVGVIMQDYSRCCRLRRPPSLRRCRCAGQWPGLLESRRWVGDPPPSCQPCPRPWVGLPTSTVIPATRPGSSCTPHPETSSYRPVTGCSCVLKLNLVTSLVKVCWCSMPKNYQNQSELVETTACRIWQWLGDYRPYNRSVTATDDVHKQRKRKEFTPLHISGQKWARS